MGALGASLLAMVAGLPKTRTGVPAEREALDAARADLQRLQRTLVDLVDRDAAAYDLVVAAFRKPKATDDEKARRSQAIQDAMRVATEVPMETYRAAVSALVAGRTVAACGNPSARSDIAVAVHALQAAMSGAALNVETNIGSLKDAGLVERFTNELRSAHAEGTAALPDIYGTPELQELIRQGASRLGGHGRFPED
jgi:glutamate formiminotransferase/formiminotetrahydrofolate cyclodeaminase